MSQKSDAVKRITAIPPEKTLRAVDAVREKAKNQRRFKQIVKGV